MTRPLSPETLRALRLVRDGVKPIDAARQAGINRSTLSRALRHTYCPCCGSQLPKAINKSDIIAQMVAQGIITISS